MKQIFIEVCGSYPGATPNAYWDTIEDSMTPESYAQYLDEAYPDYAPHFVTFN